MDKTSVSKATLGRLPMYLDFLKSLSVTQYPYISSTAIAKSLNLGEVQVRKDLNSVSGGGKPKIGYVAEDLIKSIENCLGGGGQTCAVLVGAGKLGRALFDFDGFERYGVKIAAAFDCNEQVIQLSAAKKILPMNCFDAFCRENGVKIGIITVGEGSAQEVCDRMIKSGITAIWSFAPCRLKVPEGVLLRQENLALSLAHLNNRLCN